MTRRRARFALLFLVFLWGSLLSTAESGGAQTKDAQKVFTDLGLPHADVVMDVYMGQLRMRETTHLPDSWSCYLVDEQKFCKDLKEIESNYKKYEIQDKLAVRGDDLYYDGAPVQLPPGVQMRLIWQAVLWKGWVICLGRTSNTDKPANMTPPFFATELITFSASRRIAGVKYLSFNPPGGTRLYILTAR